MNIELALSDVLLVREILEDFLREFDAGLPDEGSLKDQIYRVHSIFNDVLCQQNVIDEQFSSDVEEYEEQVGRELEAYDKGVQTERIESAHSNLSNTPKEVAYNKWDYTDGYVGNPDDECTYGSLGDCSCHIHFSA